MKSDNRLEFVKDLDLCKFEIANQKEYLIGAEKVLAFLTFDCFKMDQTLILTRNVCDLLGKLYIDHGLLLPDQSPNNEQINVHRCLQCIPNRL